MKDVKIKAFPGSMSLGGRFFFSFIALWAPPCYHQINGVIKVKKLFGKKDSDRKIQKSLFSCGRGDLTIRGTEYRPSGAEKFPAAIVCHGFMAFQDTVRQYAKALAEMGYVSYCFDFCGGSVVHGKSDGDTDKMSVLTEVEDLEAVMGYVKSLEYVSGEKILLMGCSQGGFVSALTAVKHREEVGDLILFYPAFCIPDDGRAGKMMLAKFDPDNIPEKLRCGPMVLGRRYVEDVINMDPFEEIKDYPGNVLIVHGTKDGIVKPRYSERAYESYLRARDEKGGGGKLQLKFIDGAGHGFLKRQDKTAIGYLKEFLG